MLSLFVEDGSLLIRDIDKSQLVEIAEWFNSSDIDKYKYAMATDKPITYNKLHEKYLEALVNAHEFFLSINIDGNFIGYIKGRVEYKNQGEIWIMSMLINAAWQNKGIGKRTINLLIEEFKEKFGIKKIYVCLVKDNIEGKNFWGNNYFFEYRLSKDFFLIDNKTYDLIIMYRQTI